MNRRHWLVGLGSSALGLVLAGCDKLAQSPTLVPKISKAETFNLSVQRLLGRHALAREFTRADISRDFKANGTLHPGDADYQALAANQFADYVLTIDGLVEQPMKLTLEQLRAEAARTQITRHDCVEGWSSIGEWTGAKLAPLLEKARLKPQAKYIVFHCLDTLAPGAADNTQGRYYESIDLIDAFHPQTILAYQMNGQPLPIPHGAPVRLRVERQLGYKHAKYVGRIEAVADLKGIGGGQGGFWEDRGYEWFAGI
ncbi:MAG TPA: molybdopterin-dependent oxidoreductase [Caulobacteraceae bacterium]|nr:molybdopterin-dependent oxidoreductase [Caulobacteraceae bacterium]